MRNSRNRRCLAASLGVIVAALSVSVALGATAPEASRDSAAPQVNPTDVSFMMFAARAVHSESAIAELAATRSQNADVKALADKVKTNHDKIAADLATLAGSRNVKLPTDLEPDQKNAASKLAKLSTTAFDKAFLDYLVADHQDLLQRFTKSQRTTPDGDVRTFAEKSLQTLRETLQQTMNVKAMIR